MNILVIDDDGPSLDSLCLVLGDLGHRVTPCSSAEVALDALTNCNFPLIISDIRLPGMDGLALLSAIKSRRGGQDSDVVLITGHGNMDTAVEALRRGAYDFLNKPINAADLAGVVERSAEHQALLRENRELSTQFEERVKRETGALRLDLNRVKKRLREVEGIGEISAVSQSFKQVVRDTAVYHKDPTVPVLIEGETGTGKEVVARLIHYGEGGNDCPFVPLNCSAIAPELFESELFGYEAGAFTGSRREGAKGKLELAGEGTLFLDEIGDLPLAMQPKLLRVLQDRSYYQVGGVKKQTFRARIICATNQALSEMIAGGNFRRDLYHRLMVGHIVIPPLRDRIEEIQPLAKLFLRREAEKRRKTFSKISPEATHFLRNYEWQGNIRELENAIERVVLMHDEDELTLEHLSFLTGGGTGMAVADVSDTERVLLGGELPDDGLQLDELNKEVIRRARAKFNANQSRTAQSLGMSRGALRNRIEQL
ncbi:MAG: sigma-54-dependent transcriptional regulator [Planctomycetota bacterium]|jgi:DNA-binding NtrC family response regulator